MVVARTLSRAACRACLARLRLRAGVPSRLPVAAPMGTQTVATKLAPGARARCCIPAEQARGGAPAPTDPSNAKMMSILVIFSHLALPRRGPNAYI